MASRELRFVETMNMSEVRVAGSFRPNGSSGVVANSSVGRGWSVARTTTGKYLITYQDAWPNLVALLATARSSAGTPTVVTPGVYTPAVPSTGAPATQEIYVSQAGTNVDMAANVDNVVNFEAIFGNASFV